MAASPRPRPGRIGQLIHRARPAQPGRGRGTRRGRWQLLPALAALVAGLVLLGVGIAGQRTAPEPGPAAYGTVSGGEAPTPTASSTPTATPIPSPAPSPSPTPSSTPTPSAAGLSLPASKPVSVSIPAIKVHSAIVPIGKDGQGGLAVPQPGPNLNKVAWYEHSPTPGQTGPAVLEGHVDTLKGPSVFLRLGALRPGDTIAVTRKDQRIAVFTITAVRAYSTHGDFPTDLVYGGDLSAPTLRVITCSNFDHATGHYVGNTIVFAHLTSVRGPTAGR